MSLVHHPLYRLRAKMLLERHAREGSAEAKAILDDGDMLEFYFQGLPTAMDADPTPVPPAPTPSGHPILDAISALIAKIVANPQAFISFLMAIFALFPK